MSIPQDGHQVIKSSNIGWIWFGLGLGLTVVIIGGSHSRLDVWPIVSGIWIFSGLATAGSLWHRIIVSSSGIVVYEVFSKTELLFEQVQQVDIKRVATGRGTAYALEIKGDDLPKSPLLFSLVLYNSSAIITLVKNVNHFAPQVGLGIYAKNVMRGSFL